MASRLKYQVEKTNVGVYLTSKPIVTLVSLPMPPFAIPETDRSETAPRIPSPRCNLDWRKDDVLRHAARIKA